MTFIPEPISWNGGPEYDDREPCMVCGDSSCSGASCMDEPDFRIHDHGTIIGFEPVTDDAKHFVAHAVETESWQWMDGVLLVDHRPAQQLLDTLIVVEGFSLEMVGV